MFIILSQETNANQNNIEIPSHPQNGYHQENKQQSQAPVAHFCNPGYSGGRNQKDRGSKQARQIVRDTISQKTHHKKRAYGVAQGVGPEFKPQYHKKKKKQQLP
jgi:hypothetical protein